MFIGFHRQRISGKCLNLFLNNSALKQVSVAKYLRVYFDHRLTWNFHINYYVLQRVRRKLYVINRLRPVAPKVLHLLYQAFVLPIFDYCDSVVSIKCFLYLQARESSLQVFIFVATFS